MPKSLFRIEPPPVSEEERRHDRFIELIDVLIKRLEDNVRMDIRDQIAALALIDRVISREKPDDTAAAGSKARQYAAVLQTPDGTRRGTPDPGPAEESGDASGDDSGKPEPDEDAGDA